LLWVVAVPIRIKYAKRARQEFVFVSLALPENRLNRGCGR
jgi:hypothetical protein